MEYKWIGRETHQYTLFFRTSHSNGLIAVLKISIKLSDIRVPKGLPSTSTKTNVHKEQLMAVVFSSALTPLKHSFCVNRTVSGTLWLYHPSHLPPSIWPVLPSPVPSLHTWESVGISPPNDLSLQPVLCKTWLNSTHSSLVSCWCFFWVRYWPDCNYN